MRELSKIKTVTLFGPFIVDQALNIPTQLTVLLYLVLDQPNDGKALAGGRSKYVIWINSLETVNDRLHISPIL